MPYKDIAKRNERQKIYGKKHYDENRDYYVQKALRRKVALREWYAGLKRKPCERCGHQGHPGAMQFHHRDPALKEFNVSTGWYSRSRAAVLAEVAKCELLCADCHAEEHELL